METRRLPVETQELVIEHLHDDKFSLASCSLTCKAWLPKSRSLLFRKLARRLDKNDASLTRLASFLRENHAVAASVRVLRVCSQNAGTLIDTEERRLASVVTLLPNLESLAITELQLVQLMHLARHEQLHSSVTRTPLGLRLIEVLPRCAKLRSVVLIKANHFVSHVRGTFGAPPPSSELEKPMPTRFLSLRSVELTFSRWDYYGKFLLQEAGTSIQDLSIVIPEAKYHRSATEVSARALVDALHIASCTNLTTLTFKFDFTGNDEDPGTACSWRIIHAVLAALTPARRPHTITLEFTMAIGCNTNGAGRLQRAFDAAIGDDARVRRLVLVLHRWAGVQNPPLDRWFPRFAARDAVFVESK